MERVRKHIVIRGDVQGVGFRYRMYYAARNNGVSGWVRNDYDGSVEAELEGEESAIDRTVADVNAGRFVTITDMEIKRIPVHNDHSFEIR